MRQHHWWENRTATAALIVIGLIATVIVGVNAFVSLIVGEHNNYHTLQFQRSPDQHFVVGYGLVYDAAQSSPRSVTIVWDTATGKRLWQTPEAADKVAISSDSKALACEADGTVRFFDARTGGQKNVLREAHLWGSAPDEPLFLVPWNQRLGLWDGLAHEPILLHQAGITQGQEMRDAKPLPQRQALVWFHSGDGSLIALVSQTKTRVLLKTQMGVESIAVSPDGKHFALGRSGGTAQLFETATGKRLGQQQEMGWNDLAFRNNHQLVANSWVWDFQAGTFHPGSGVSGEVERVYPRKDDPWLVGILHGTKEIKLYAAP